MFNPKSIHLSTYNSWQNEIYIFSGTLDIWNLIPHLH